MRTTLRLSVCLTLIATPALAATIRVPDDQPAIQAGIDAASYGDTVLVACGTYYEHDIEMKSGVCLTSETGYGDCVTIDAQQLGRVFYCDGVDSLTSVVGFSITGGLATQAGGGVVCSYSSPLLMNCRFVENTTGRYGGGMSCYRSSPMVRDCRFTENMASSYGGAIYCSESSPTLTGCTFSGNQAPNGGGMCCHYPSSPTLTGCTFLGNQASDGAGMYCFETSSPTLTDCTFLGNQAGGTAGGVCCHYSSMTVTRCRFSGNQADLGGGIHSSASTLTITGCTFSGNQASDGAGMFCFDCSPTLTVCIIGFSQLGSAVCCPDDGSTPLLACCDLYGNAGGDWVGCVADQYGINGNFSEDPLFCLDDNPDEPYNLHEDSPCLPENSPCGELVGAFGEGCGPVSPVEDTSWGAIKAMYR